MTNIKKKKHEQFIKQIYRLTGYYFAEKLKNTIITANHITISRIPLIILISLLILSNNYFLHILASLLILIFSMLDALDGSLATLKNERSVLGTWLDPQIDRFGFLLLFLTLAYILSSISEIYIYLTLYVLIVFYLRGLIPSDIRLKDKFISLRNGLENNKYNFNKEKKNSNNFLYQLKMQTTPHTHNVAMYIALGLVFKITHFIIIFLSFYLTLWYFWENYKVIIKSIKVDTK